MGMSHDVAAEVARLVVVARRKRRNGRRQKRRVRAEERRCMHDRVKVHEKWA
jgi:hypothetical protein